MVNPEDFKAVQPKIVRRPSRFRGPLSSSDYNDLQDAIFHDIMQLSEGVNSNRTKLIRAILQMYEENKYLRRRIDALEEKSLYREFSAGKMGTKIERYIDFSDSRVVIFPSTLLAEKAASYKSQYGEIALPANAIENKFYNFSLRTRNIVIPDDFVVVVDGQFDKVDGAGIQDYEHGGIISHGEPRYAFNGVDENVWERKVSFPLESDVDQVEVQMVAVVPSGVSTQANLIEIVPYPEGSVDIMQLSTSSNLGSSFVLVDGFVEENNFVAKRYHFSPRNVDQIKIHLRCRNWTEIGGRKVFSYGLRECGLKLVDYKKLYTDSDGFGQNYTAVVKIDAPTGHVFSNLYRLDPKPNFIKEDVDVRHVRLRLSTTQDFSGVFWDSATDIQPQLGISVGVSMQGASTIYAIYTLKFVDSSGGFQSPFPIGTTPTLSGLGLVYSISPTEGLN